MLGVKAIQREPDVLSYRINAAHVLVAQGNTAGAISVLQMAKLHAAKTPREVAAVDEQIASVEKQVPAADAAKN